MNTTFEVGGCLRDELMGKSTKDIDFVVLAESFAAMEDMLVEEGFHVHTRKPEFATIRCGVPKGHPLRARTKDADFVLARKDAPSSDGRHPDFVEAGTLEDDLARRDFTMNAIARDPLTGEFIDPHGGVRDISIMKLRFVGDPIQRITEDGLRVLRGFRFVVTKGVTPTVETHQALVSDTAIEMLARPSMAGERFEEEIAKMISFDHNEAVHILNFVMPHEMLELCHRKMVDVPGAKGRPPVLVTSTILAMRDAL